MTDEPIDARCDHCYLEFEPLPEGPPAVQSLEVPDAPLSGELRRFPEGVEHQEDCPLFVSEADEPAAVAYDFSGWRDGDPLPRRV